MLRKTKTISKKNKIIIFIFAFLVFIYLIGVLFLNNSFPSGTKINNISVSGYSSNGALVKIRSSMEYHEMNVHFDNKDNALVKYSDSTVSYITLGATFNNQKALSQINKVKAINKWFWPITMFNNSKEYTIFPYDFNEDVLKKTVTRLSYFDQQKTKEPKNAYISYDDKVNRYIIIPEEYGTNIDMNLVYQEFENEFSKNKSTWNINESSLYQKPKITSNDAKLIKTLKFVNSHLNSHITYTFNNSVICELKPEEMINWVNKEGADDNELTETAIKNKIEEFLNKNLDNKCYVNGDRYSFLSSEGIKTIETPQKKLAIDINSETDYIYNMLLCNISLKKEPIFKNQIFSSNEKEVAGNYIEINREKKCINFYVNNSIASTLKINSIGDIQPNVFYKTDFQNKSFCEKFKISIPKEWERQIDDFLSSETPILIV